MFHILATSSAHRFASWLDTPAGQGLLAEQASHLAEAARRFHGDTLLWAGCHTGLTHTVSGCMIRHRVYIGPAALTSAPPQPESESEPTDGLIRDLVRVQGSLHALPFRNNALDAVVLHHALDIADDPRTALRELTRVLAPGGRLLVCGFNPWSLLGLRYAYARVVPDSFTGLRFVTPGRILDWLTVLGFELQDNVKYLAYGLPFGGDNPADQDAPGLWTQLNTRLVGKRVPFGGVYVLSAVKQAVAVRPDWRPGRVRTAALAPVAYPKLGTWKRIARDR